MSSLDLSPWYVYMHVHDKETDYTQIRWPSEHGAVQLRGCSQSSTDRDADV